MKKNNDTKRNRGLRMTDSMKQKYAELFIDALESMEKSEWKKPWVSPHNGIPCNLYRKSKPYRSSNAFFLTMLMQIKGWNTPYFITKMQMKNEDGQLKYSGLTANSHLLLDDNGMPIFNDQGVPSVEVEKRFPIIFWKPFHKDKDGNKLTDEEYDELTEEEKQQCSVRFFQDSYLVYNIDQTNLKELYPDDYAAMIELPKHDYEEGMRDDVVEKMIYGEWRCPIQFGGHSAFYSPAKDTIRLPERSHFLGDEMFYSTAIHEMAHSTAKELGRDIGHQFGSEDYAMEEFVAELSSACVCSMLGIGKLLDQDHVSYVDGWRKALKHEKNFIPLVIDHVQKAANYILKCYEKVAKQMEMPIALPSAA